MLQNRSKISAAPPLGQFSVEDNIENCSRTFAHALAIVRDAATAASDVRPLPSWLGQVAVIRSKAVPRTERLFVEVLLTLTTCSETADDR